MAREKGLPDKVPPGEVEIIDGIAWYRGSRPFAELPFPSVPPEVADDYDWARQEPQVQRDYTGLVVAVHNRKVWGAGKSRRAALEDAFQKIDCPPADELVLVVI